MARRKITKKAAARKYAKHPMVRPSRFFIPWPYIFFLLLCIGVLLAGMTFKTDADEIVVKAKVPSPPLTQPAIITSPTNGARFTSVPITVKGTCADNSYVKLYRNDVFSGSVHCTSSGTFQLNTDLFPGTNLLKAQGYNFADEAGPPSDPVTVHYDIPQPAEPAPGAPAASTPLIIKTEFKFVGYYTGQTGKWKLEISGGTPPYAINVDWGDGSNSVISKKGPGEVIITHKYDRAGEGDNHTFTIKVTGSDSDGNKAYLEFFVIVNSNNLPEIVADTLPTAKPPGTSQWLWLAWPAYLVVILMITSFYLGEREELVQLRHRGRLRRS